MNEANDDRGQKGLENLEFFIVFYCLDFFTVLIQFLNYILFYVVLIVVSHFEYPFRKKGMIKIK